MKLQFVSELKQHKVRALKTLAVCLSYVCLGLQTSASVALLDLQVLAGCTFQEITLILTGGSIGYACGSVVAGFIESKLNPQLMISFATLISALVQFGYPLSRTVYLMVALSVVCGFAGGIMDCFSNIFILKLWAKECPPFLQALHFCYGVGSFITPLIAAPYLKEDGTEHDDQNTNQINTTSSNITAKPKLTPDDIELIVPYSIIGSATGLVSIFMFTLFVLYRETTDHPSRSAKVYETKNGEQVEVNRVINPNVRLIVILLTACFLLLYAGMEQTVGHLVAAFAHDGPLHLPKQVGAKISAVFWITFTTFRFVAVIGSGIFGTLSMLIFNIITTIISSITLCSGQHSVPAFWFSCAFMGVGLSSTWGCIFAFSESQFPLHGKIVATFTVGAAVGSSLTPAAIGYLMGFSNSVFAWFPLVFSVLTAIIFIAIYIICKTCLYEDDEVKKVVEEGQGDFTDANEVVLNVGEKLKQRT